MRMISKVIIALSIFAVLFISCIDQKEVKSVPDYVIDKEKMIDLLVEVHMTEAILERKQGYKPKKGKDYTAPCYRVVFDSFKVTPQQFDTNIVWYQQDLENFEEMYNQVMIKITKLKGEHKEKIEKEKEKKKKAKADKK